jgi:medium-chain acyl-[acyl-carrier-protein] hydrolase
MDPHPDVHWKEYHRIRTYEVDYTNRLKLNSIFNFLQEAASKSADSLGFGYKDFEKENLYWVLSRVRVILLDNQRVGDTICIETWPKAIEGVFATRDFRIYDSDENIICLATSSWALLDAKTMRPLPGAELQKRVHHMNADSAIDEVPGKIMEPSRKDLVYERPVRYLDLDVNRHVNNVRYVEYLLDAFPMEHYQSRKLVSVQVNFLNEALYGDILRIYKGPYEEQEELVYLAGVNQHDRKIFQARVEWQDF